MKIAKWTIVAGSVAASIWLGCLIIAPQIFKTWERSGQFGDTFGAANALFTGLAFVALVATLLFQRQDLELQREELKLQREELRGSRTALNKQAGAQRLQVRASIVTTRIAALEVQVEAIKMTAEQFAPPGRDRHAHELRAISADIIKLAQGLELELREVDADTK